MKPLESVEVKDIREAVRKILERALSEETLEKLPAEEVTQAIIEILKNSDDSGSNTITQVFKDEEGRSIMWYPVTEETEEGLKQNIVLTEEELKQKVASGEFIPIRVKSEAEGTLGENIKYMFAGPPLSEGLQEILNEKFTHIPTEPMPLTSTESQPSSAHSVLTPSDPSVDSTVISSETSENTAQFSDEDWTEVEKLLSEFSDEDWAELDRLLRDSAVEETPQRDEGALLNPKQQQQIEKVVEKTPVDPSVRREVQYQRRLPLEGNADVRKETEF